MRDLFFEKQVWKEIIRIAYHIPIYFIYLSRPLLYAASYLQKVVEAGAEERTFHQDLAMLLLANLKENDSKINQDKLRNLILTSDYLNFETLLRLLPPRGLWSIRAALYERLER